MDFKWTDPNAKTFWDVIHQWNAIANQNKLSPNIVDVLQKNYSDRDFLNRLLDTKNRADVLTITDDWENIDPRFFVGSGGGKGALASEDRPSEKAGELTSNALGCDTVQYIERPAFQGLKHFGMFQCQSVNRILGCSLTRCRTRLISENSRADVFDVTNFMDVCKQNFNDFDEGKIIEELTRIDAKGLSQANRREVGAQEDEDNKEKAEGDSKVGEKAEGDSKEKENIIVTFFSCRKHRFHFPYNLAKKLFSSVGYSREQYGHLADQYRDRLNKTQIPDTFKETLKLALDILKEDRGFVTELDSLGEADIADLELLVDSAVKHNQSTQGRTGEVIEAATYVNTISRRNNKKRKRVEPMDVD